MSRIVVRNSCIIIQDYEKGSCLELEKNFMIWEPLTHKMVELGMHYDAEKKSLYLPRGIDIWKIKKYIGERNYFTEMPNEYSPISDIKMKLKPRDDEQIKALQFMCGIGEFEENAYLPQLSVNLPTGKGKTYCSIATIAFLKMKAIVITASTSLLNQWINNIKEYTNLTDRDIFNINGSQSMNMIYNNKSLKAKNASIFLISHATIHSYGENYGWDKLNEVFKNLAVGVKIIDEAHQNFNNMLMLDFYTNVFKTYYVTATPQRSDWRENRIYQLSLKNVPFVDLFDENNDPHTDYIAIKWNSKPRLDQVSSCKNMYGLDRMKYIDYVTRQPNFYKMLNIIMDLVLKCKGKVLMYIGTNDGILRVYNWMNENYPELIGQIGIYTSLLSKEAKKTEREKKIILSTTKSMGAGEDIKGLKMTIVVAEPFKSEVLARQTLGRTRDNDTLYVELVDLGFNHIKKYYYQKLTTFCKYASSTSDTMLDQYELDKRCEKLLDIRENRGVESPFIFDDLRFKEN